MRGRPAGVGVAALMLVAIVAALGAPAASAACPNEAFRTGPSALLPECRAYEQVTPVDKEGGEGAYEVFGPTRANPSGDGIYFSSLSAFAGSPANVLFNPYVATRSDAGWSTKAIGAPQSSVYTILEITTRAVSQGLGFSFDLSQEALAPGGVPGGSNLYLHDNRTGAYTTVAGLPRVGPFAAWVNGAPVFVDAAADFSDILIVSEFALTPDAPEGQRSLYEFRDGHLELVVAGAEPAGTKEATPNVMSDDGSRFFYLQGGVLYEHLQGSPPLRMSEDEAGGELQSPQFLGATPDGGIAFFLASGGVYRFEASRPAGSRVTRVTPELDADGNQTSVGSAFVGEDGRSVYLSSTAPLTPGAPRTPEGSGLYAWRAEPGGQGVLRYVGTSDVASDSIGPRDARVSPDGRFFGFSSYGRLTSDVTEDPTASCGGPFGEISGRCSNVFLYSYDADRLVCVTCDGSPPVGNSSLGGLLHRGAAVRTVQSPVLDDGSIFFETRDALSPADSNGALDVYSWRDGATSLISTGTDPGSSSFLDASADGSDVFFITLQRLVGQDVDSSTDVYDARVDGGLPQGGPPATPSCIVGADCREGTAPVSPPAQLGSGTAGAEAGDTAACDPSRQRARAARRRSQVLARRARRADGARAAAIRRSASREAVRARRLARTAGICTGGGR